MSATQETNSIPQHPLDPLSGEELSRAVAILNKSGKTSEEAALVCGLPVEPPKAAVLAHAPGAPFERAVRLIGHDRAKGQSFEARVSLSSGSLESFAWAEEGSAPSSAADVIELYKAVYPDPAWREALRKRGIEDLSLVHIEPWVTSLSHPEMPANARVFRGLTFLHAEPEDNYYARPVEGLMVYCDINSGQVIVEDRGVVPVPSESGEYAADKVGPLRTDLRPLEITQPEGPSFEVEGQLIRWQKWQFRFSVHPIEGLVLHQVGYEEDGRLRPILYRASLSDMAVPYGDPSPSHSWKNAFDASEALLGHLGNSLKLGCDCLGEIHYFDATVLNVDGSTRTIENAVCLHEEDYGILWKHTNAFSLQRPPPVEVRRSRRLVISMIHTVGNYEYGFYWYFYLDGTIQMEVKLTGIVAVSATADGQGTDTAPLIAPNIVSPIHQHLFCFRLDFSVDGSENTVQEVDVEPLPEGEANPAGSGFRAVTRPLRTEAEAQRKIDPTRSRHWRVVNPERKNRLGNPVGYKLLPQASSTLLAGENSNHGRRGGFARHNLWVTPYSPDEIDAAGGPFNYGHPGGAGLPAYTAGNRPIENTDVVVWHTVGMTHVPRPEDWPVMPVEYTGFTLLPVGFFDQNPALDVPPSKTCGAGNSESPAD